MTTRGVMISLSCTALTLPVVSARQRLPAVPLEAGAGPENPPCPGLRGAALRLDRRAARPRRAGQPLRELRPRRRRRAGGAPRTPCASSTGTRPAARSGSPTAPGFAAWIGGAGWAGLEPASRYLFTAEAVRRLVARRDQVVTGARWAPGAGIATMWQTVLNGFTFGRNVALGALGRGRGGARREAMAAAARRPDQRPRRAPAMLVALPLELLAAAFRRGGALSLRVELL